MKFLKILFAAVLMVSMAASCGGIGDDEESNAAVDEYGHLLPDKEQTKFLEENAKKPGVKVTDSGLQYRVIKEGTGEKPGPEDQVVVHYTGKLTNGKVFDSSEERGEPATFGVNQVIKGWTEALQMMPVGSEWELVIPAELAYGSRGQSSIPPNSTLIFNVKLLEIKK